MRIRTLILFGVILALCGVAFFGGDEARAWMSGYFSLVADEPVPVMRTALRDYRVIVPARGELTGLKTTPVFTPRVRTGSLKVAWLIPEGTVVEAGETLIYFDDSEARLALQQSQNELSSFDQRIRQTRAESEGDLEVLEMDHAAAELELGYAHNQIRKDEDIFSRWEIEMSLMSAALAEYKREAVEEKTDLRTHLSSTNMNILHIDQKKAEAETDLATETLSSLRLVAPEGGVVIYERHRFTPLEVGFETWPGNTLMQIAGMNQFQGLVYVSETDIAGVDAGDPVEVWIEAFPDQSFKASISRVDRVARQIHRDDPRKYFECGVILDVPADMMQRMRPGMQLRTNIEAAPYERVIVLPKSAVMKEGSRSVVYTRDGEEYERQEVKILDSDHGFYVVEGLEEGSVVCLRHPFEKEQLRLPDFNAPAPTRQRRFVVFN